MKLYGNTDIGKTRSFNQDAYENAILAGGAVLSVVCDGMGGAAAGDIASKKAVECIGNYVKNAYFPDMDAFSLEKLLRNAVESANIEIFDMSASTPEYNGMGTTAVVALVKENTAYIVHVGDSRAYLIGEEISQITRDHSMIQSLIENGKLTKEEAKNHPHKNVITRAVGIAENVQCDYNEVDITDKILLICTDGLSGMLSDDIILKTAKSVPIDALPQKLTELANDLNSTDNITVTVISR